MVYVVFASMTRQLANTIRIIAQKYHDHMYSGLDL